MLTPKHRALFAAAYGSPILRVAGDDTEVRPAPADADEPETKRPAEEPRRSA